MNITLYKKNGCPWAAAVVGFLKALDIPFATKDVSANPEFAAELRAKSGQVKSPTLEIDGNILADASVEDVAEYLEENGVQV
jgi:glutaredoxin